MEQYQAALNAIKESVEKAKEIVLVTHAHPTVDSIGSMLSLYMGLSDLGKTVSLVCPDPMTVEFSNFIGVDKVETQLAGKKNFVISLDYQEGSIEKVSYNIEGNKFNLVIEPRPGFEQFSKDNVTYTHTGGRPDLMIVLDTQHLGQLGAVYEKEKELFATVPIITIDAHEGNAMFGATNLVDPQASSTIELTAVVMSFIGVKLTEDIATNLFNTIDHETNHFQSPRVNARTFEIASVSMKAGAKRFIVPAPQEHQIVEEKEQREILIEPSQQDDDVLKPKIFKTS